ncbi:MAG: T9SS type A sorting domain-containing protein [Saprospiraceae bacterium]|nr:T9SS type A sorting domain-containing protein [Saprospiraceae bacterium]
MASFIKIKPPYYEKIHPLVGALLLAASLSAQCAPPRAISYLHGNEIRAAVTSGGDLFWDGQNPQFRLPAESVTTIFAQGLWLGGLSPSGDFKFALQMYNRAQNRSDYATGPVYTGQPFDPAHCKRWDRVWAATSLASIYRTLNGVFGDGTPITASGNGYQAGGAETRFAFHGDPNNPAQWSMRNANLSPFDVRGLGSVLLGRLEPGQWTTVETAYLYVREPGLNYLQNVTAMYAQLEALQADYENGFADTCLPVTLCADDCIWPGDANADGIANHEDFLAIGRRLGASGPARGSFLNWAPHSGNAWSVAGVKHADTDGNGVVQVGDAAITMMHYNRTRPGYTYSDTYPPGPELTVTSTQPNAFLNITEGTSILSRISLLEVPQLKGIAFSLEYDPRYFEGIVENPNAVVPELWVTYPNTARHQLDFAWYKRLTLDFIGAQNSLHIFHIKARDHFSEPVPSDTTYLRFKNIIGIRADGSLVPIGGMDMMATFLGVFVADEEAAPLSSVRLFPNPTDGLLQLQFPGQQLDRIALLTPAGQVLRVVQGPLFDAHQLRLEGLPTGMYFVRMEQAGRAAMRKVVLR